MGERGKRVAHEPQVRFGAWGAYRYNEHCWRLLHLTEAGAWAEVECYKPSLAAALDEMYERCLRDGVSCAELGGAMEQAREIARGVREAGRSVCGE